MIYYFKVFTDVFYHNPSQTYRKHYDTKYKFKRSKVIYYRDQFAPINRFK